MSGVVRRCPNCGTSQAGPGECEACHEAPVAFFCTNHTPGRWIEAPACASCGARFGVAAAPARPAPPPRPAPAPPPRRAAPPPPRSSTPWGRAAPRPMDTVGPGDAWTPERDPTARRLRDFLLRGRAAAPFPVPARREAPMPPVNPMAGFGGRLVKLGFLFVAGMFLLSLLSGAPLLQILLSILFSS